MTATIDDALELAVINFRGIEDKDGEPYILHCLRVMTGVTGAAAQQVAIMHDLVEDTGVTLEDLRNRGFSKEVVTAIDLMTHREEHSYAEYVIRLKPNPLAREVKLADLRDNAALNRVLFREDRLTSDLKRVQRYLLSYQYLNDRIDEASYRARMAEVQDD